ncbi:MAG: hypothetical protein COV35_04560 [Alphaproteobacteria bacterium CG11_big_fil_rev_8_21_14_0_20_39_49]|nr:MAG: hypothetical protein COV35_04560 [Alphaproteobacteria bacterium CG11_big_fil_rev_8_21_14_0_20_39_49]
MPKNMVCTESNEGFYFITPTIWNWYYIFDRHNRWHILSDSLKYCQEQKGLEIYAYVFMLNHIHLIIKSPDVAGFLRDFKKYTSKKLKEDIIQTEPKVIDLFNDEKVGYRFWKEDNQPKIVENEKFFMEKMNYIHNNPVAKGYVERPEHWKWSSANENSFIKVSKLW